MKAKYDDSWVGERMVNESKYFHCKKCPKGPLWLSRKSCNNHIDSFHVNETGQERSKSEKEAHLSIADIPTEIPLEGNQGSLPTDDQDSDESNIGDNTGDNGDHNRDHHLDDFDDFGSMDYEHEVDEDSDSETEQPPPILEDEGKDITCETTLAMMSFRRLTLLHGIPNSVANTLLTREYLDKMQRLEGYTMQQIDKKLDKHVTQLGEIITLESNTKVKYIPISHSLMRSPEKPRRDLIIYWDGFKKFRNKGGSIGFISFHNL